MKRRKKNLKIKKSKKIFIQEKFFDFEIFFSSLKNLDRKKIILKYPNELTFKRFCEFQYKRTEQKKKEF
ncbi:hypothetical protein BpHYR1_050603 [Brachionus plicatilis]|uniref:Uncharacterized protein n=1 Tax=Brachionus plicatilis TaxID=10195 RepID=A0A3M7SVL3_BRAPC|nr:hypothetical protein BpHYR1_050603 [Brachionus plicatilis]